MKLRTIIVAWLAAVAGVALFAAAATTAKFGSLAAGDAAPDFKVVGPGGKEIKLSDFKGKTVVLNFWSPNRGPADALQGPFLKYQDAGVVVLGIGTGATRDEFDKAVAKAKEGVGYPLAWDPAGPNRAASVAQKLFGVAVFPATGVIDKDGKIVGGFVGFGAQAPVVLRGFLRDAGVAVAAEEAAKPAAGPGPAAPGDAMPKIGTAAPDFAALDPASKPVKLSDFAGKIVVLDFWATWCGPCLAAMPHTQQIAAAAKAEGVVVLAACTSDTREKFEAWMKENAAKYPDLIFANDPNGRDTPATFEARVSKKLYGVSGIPTQFVIGRDGKVAEIIVGYDTGDPRLARALRELGVKLAPAATEARTDGAAK